MKVTKSFMAAVSFAAVALGFSMQVHASNLGVPGPLSLSDYDLDKNGVISAEEFKTVRQKREAALKAAGHEAKGMDNAPSFADLDANGDGSITPSELEAARQARQGNVIHDVKGVGKGMGMEKHK